MSLTIDTIHTLCTDKSIEMTEHVLKRCNERNIRYMDIKDCIMNGEIIEQYPTDYPYPSCLILGLNINKECLHVVVGTDLKKLWIITAYYPNNNKWADDYKTRKEN